MPEMTPPQGPPEIVMMTSGAQPPGSAADFEDCAHKRRLQRAIHLIRLRPNVKLEIARAWAQLLLGIVSATLLLILFFALQHGVSPVAMPRRFVGDTFGPVDGLWHLEPPCLNRTRFESEENVWRPVVFSPDWPLGFVQDCLWGVFNWVMRTLWTGPIYKKVIALGVGWVSCWPFMWTGKFLLDSIPLRIKAVYLRHMPESLLMLEQLYWAQKAAARKLSPAAQADLNRWDEANPDD